MAGDVAKSKVIIHLYFLADRRSARPAPSALYWYEQLGLEE